MRNILTILTLALTVIALPALAQTEKKAKDILDASNKKLKSVKTLKTDFTLELLGGGVNDKKKGTFLMKGDKYRVDINNKEMVMMTDNKTSWTYLKQVNEVQVTDYDANSQTLSPAKLLTNFYDKEYNYKYAGLRKIEGKTCHVIELKPRSSDKQFSKVELAIDKEDNTIVGGQIWEKNGNQYRYTLTNYKTNIPLKDELFSFSTKEFPGASEVDLR